LTYRVEMESRATRDLRALPNQVLRRVDTAILALQSNPIPQGAVRGRVGKGGALGLGITGSYIQWTQNKWW
jgi:mRNA-degrading endonuclease RelE of RelBE toxin-antitoxin system